MKKIVVLLLVCLGGVQVFSQTLFSYGPYQVSKDEFLRAYNKNKIAVTDKEQSIREYLDLYSKFKLKVKAAQLQQLDTLQQLKYDLQNFRSQVAESYMNDEKGLNALIDEAAERSMKDIHLIHFSIALNPEMNPTDTMKAYKAMNELAEELKQGKADYLTIAKGTGQKQVEIKANDLGYITVFSLPYAIENLVYQLKPGQITSLYRTKSALHIFKNEDERKTAGKWKIAQILLAVPPGASAIELKTIELKADSIYNLLVSGADFAEMARQYSQDKLTYMNGGELPEFGTGKFDRVFEAAVFSLKKDGEISKPVFTGYGYHIVKRLQQRDLAADKNDEVFLSGLKQQILKDDRVEGVKRQFLKTVFLKTRYKRNPAVKDAELFGYADSVVANKEVKRYPVNNKTIFSLAATPVKGLDWLNFIRDFKLNADVYKGETNAMLLDKFIETTCLDFYRKHLEAYDIGFKHQMQEFREGNMLFEIMERNVWSKAANDSIGLRKYYQQHKAGYKWAASASVLLFNCSDKKVAEEAAQAIADGKNWKQIAEESDGKLQSDSGRYEISQLQLPPGTTLSEGLISAPFINSGDNTSSFVKVLRMFPADQQRAFDEAKGLVINDYQNYLEEKWLDELRKLYPVKVNEAVYLSLLK